MSQRVFVVLHQSGSHGPAYYERYPPEFEYFKPICKSVDLGKCTHDELVNAYDNTILYEDYFLSRVIGVLKQLQDTAALLIYVSDHGESLGEYGMYLHGIPYAIAPDVQNSLVRFGVPKGIRTPAIAVKVEPLASVWELWRHPDRCQHRS